MALWQWGIVSVAVIMCVYDTECGHEAYEFLSQSKSQAPPYTHLPHFVSSCLAGWDVCVIVRPFNGWEWERSAQLWVAPALTQGQVASVSQIFCGSGKLPLSG